MSFLRHLFARLFARKKRDTQWAARFNNPPASRHGTLPLDPGKSELS